jgi:hypothetical protein
LLWWQFSENGRVLIIHLRGIFKLAAAFLGEPQIKLKIREP